MSTEPTAFADLLADIIGVDLDRHEVVRTGERDPIPTMTRLLVWLRDEGRCARCHRADRSLMQLDHITPWSAGGKDDASNLRVMCGPCNDTRSNFRDLDERPRRSVTPACDRCIEQHDRAHPRWWHRRHDQLVARTPIGCPMCSSSVRIAEWDPPVIAFCGLCSSPSAVTGPGRLL